MLVGTPASAGRVTGVARVVVDPVGAALAPGEILVAPVTSGTRITVDGAAGTVDPA
ncbi:MAG: hypothetical protein J2P24_03155 [Streptosporangiales bacterium]|nr:hypothetical protein [Streptosporangiales bacterium]